MNLNQIYTSVQQLLGQLCCVGICLDNGCPLLCTDELFFCVLLILVQRAERMFKLCNLGLVSFLLHQILRISQQAVFQIHI